MQGQRCLCKKCNLASAKHAVERKLLEGGGKLAAWAGKLPVHALHKSVLLSFLASLLLAPTFSHSQVRVAGAGGRGMPACLGWRLPSAGGSDGQLATFLRTACLEGREQQPLERAKAASGGGAPFAAAAAGSTARQLPCRCQLLTPSSLLPPCFPLLQALASPRPLVTTSQAL